MLYHVKAWFDEEKREEFCRILTDGTVDGQKPDGKEIVASMQRAVRGGDRVEWTETCYCDPPLNHEWTTVYYSFFSELETNPIEDEVALEGDSFWDYLTGKAE